MDFKQFINESHIPGHEPIPGLDPETVSKLNLLLLVELEKPVLTPEAGLSKIRKILYLEGIVFESMLGLNSEGDEIATSLTDTDYLYILYFLNDDGYYEFYAEVTDEQGIEDALSETEDGISS